MCICGFIMIIINEAAAVRHYYLTDWLMSCSQIEALIIAASLKAAQLNEDYVLLDKAVKFLGVISDITDTIVVKAIDLEKEYDLVDNMKESVGHAVNNVLLRIKGANYQ